MFRPLAVNIGLRYVRSRRSFISFVSVLSLAGLALSVAILVFVQAVVAGFEREMNDRVLGIVPHVTVFGRTPVHDDEDVLRIVRGIDGVAAASAVVEGAGLLATAEGTVGVSLTGVDPAEYAAGSRVFEFAQRRQAGDWGENRAQRLEAGAFRILVGVKAAQRLGIDVGDDVSVVLPEATVTPFGLFARQKRLRVAGVIDSGSQLDRFVAYLHRDDAARLFRLGDAVHGFHVATSHPLAANAVQGRIVRALGSHRYRVGTWSRTLGNLYNAIQATRNMLFLLLSLLVAVAAFNLVSSLVMIVNERRGDIAMFRTMGSRSNLVVGTFLVLGAVVAVVGIGLGIGVGVGLGIVAEAGFPYLEVLLDTPLMGEYLITRLPVQFASSDIVRVAATAMGLCLAATLFPAWRASQLNPADVLQHE